MTQAAYVAEGPLPYGSLTQHPGEYEAQASAAQTPDAGPVPESERV